MAEVSSNWDHEEENDPSPSTKSSQLNVNAVEFLPSTFISSSINENLKKKSPSTKPTEEKKKNIVVIQREIPKRKETINIVFCGHVDAGKSTIGGQLMYLTGQVDKRTLEKYQNEAREMSRESWYLSWALDTNEEERERGKTVEVARAWFETEKKHFIILDAPGHKYFVPNMISGAAQADVAILVISARKNEFETGFERAGQTREHAMLLKTVGIRHLIVLVNKMDDPTVQWNQSRYEEIKEKLTPFLKRCGFKSDQEIFFMPCSGFTGALLKEHPGETVVSWYKGPTLIDYLDEFPSFQRDLDGPFRLVVADRYKDMGLFIMGKIESGFCHVGDRCVLMPNRIPTEITEIFYEETETDSAVCGENIRMKLKNVDEEDVSSGFILCKAQEKLCSTGRIFDAQIVVLDIKNLLTVAHQSVLHIHSIAVDVRIEKIISFLDRKTGEKRSESRRFLRCDDIAIVRFELIQPGQMISMERFVDFPQLGRFTLRDEIRTIAMGKILDIIQ